MPLPRQTALLIDVHMRGIAGCFLPGAKLLLVVDNGENSRSMVAGDCTPERAREIIEFLAPVIAGDPTNGEKLRDA